MCIMSSLWSIISFNRSKKLRTSSFQWCNRMPCLKLGFWIVSVYLDLEGLIANLATLDSQYQPSKISVDLDNSKLPVLNIASHCITGKMKYDLLNEIIDHGTNQTFAINHSICNLLLVNLHCHHSGLINFFSLLILVWYIKAANNHWVIERNYAK